MTQQDPFHELFSNASYERLDLNNVHDPGIDTYGSLGIRCAAMPQPVGAAKSSRIS
ncbi:hypothetical protein BSLA_03f0864 [Burkholderia stabilis]|nr:hypothetical protein BSLA_03f0864 [Burkholderia stabilis]